MAKNKAKTIKMVRTVDEIIKELNKKSGREVCFKACDLPDVERVKLSSIMINKGLGGGLPLGRITIINGKKSVCKSAVAYDAIVKFQNEYPDRVVILADFEGSFDNDWAKKIGVDVERLLLLRPISAQEAANYIIDLIKSGGCSLVVIDSIAEAVPQEYFATDKEDERQPASLARFWNQFLGMIQGALNFNGGNSQENGCAVLLINQEREKIGMFGGTFNPGGEGKESAAAIIMDFKADEYIHSTGAINKMVTTDEKEKGDSKSPIVGTRIKFKVMKNKTAGTRGFVNSFVFYNRSFKDNSEASFDIIDEIIRIGIYEGYIIQKGGWFEYGDIKEQGLDKFISVLKDAPEILEELKKRLEGELVTSEEKVEEVIDLS